MNNTPHKSSNRPKPGDPCPYCGSPLMVTTQDKIYYNCKTTLTFKNKFLCCSNYPQCNSYSSMILTSNGPIFGTIADPKLRILRKKIHNLLDPLWKNKIISRKNLYKKISRILETDIEETHISLFDIDTCIRLLNNIGPLLELKNK